MLRLGNPPNRIDLLNFGADIPFDEVWERRVAAEIEGVPVWIISRPDFVRSKLDAGRIKDRRDLEELGEGDTG
jgi:hypothetical protein